MSKKLFDLFKEITHEFFAELDDGLGDDDSNYMMFGWFGRSWRADHRRFDFVMNIDSDLLTAIQAYELKNPQEVQHAEGPPVFL